MRVAGLGFRRGTVDFAAALAAAGPVDALATAAEKAQELAAALPGYRVLGVDVAGVETPTRSARVLALKGTGSVAEAAALVAAGPQARLVRGREVIGGVVLAVAEGEGE
ncbi:cobalamin biosynthesis protein [Rhodobacter lacus]|uniref:Cobalamin biosynthesis protein n=1 Tax=Rhodobacter lacus TaxID=1641972 RepID=A0ABW5AE03_9RHOB